MKPNDVIDFIVSAIPLYLIVFILGIDSVRAVIAALGIIDPDSKLGRIVYGKRDQSIVKSALRSLGYSTETANDIVIKMADIPKSAFMANAGVQEEDAAVQLIIMLSKYILKFNESIVYGGESFSKSNYYIDTMEISHNENDRRKLASIMIYLLRTEMNSRKAPEIIITPKGGNPLFVQEMATGLNSHLLIAKALSDKSRIKTSRSSEYSREEFFVNYEGSWCLSESGKDGICIVVDCNTSGGSQLLDIVKDVRTFIKENPSVIKAPSDVFVLFKADTEGDNIDLKFSEHQCTIHRFFDLDENAKEKMYILKDDRKRKGRNLSYYSDEDIEKAKDIIRYLDSKHLFYYHYPESEKEPEKPVGKKEPKTKEPYVDKMVLQTGSKQSEQSESLNKVEETDE